MSVAEKVKTFNGLVENLLQQLSPKLGTSYYFYFSKLIKVNAILPIQYFLNYALPLQDKIMNRDESYFTTADNHTETVGSDKGLAEIMRLTTIYQELDEDSRNELWDITQALLVIGLEYLELKK